MASLHLALRIRSILIACYLLLCILLGGSSQGIWTNLGLQLLGLALIAWAVIAGASSDQERSGSFLYLTIGFGLLVVLFQLIPLPSSIWKELPGRDGIERGLALINQSHVSLPISEAPYSTLFALFPAIPALALLIAVTILRPSAAWLASAIALGMTVAIGLGAIQVAGGPERASWAYLYSESSAGAVGVFANINHMGTLLLVAIPFCAALIASTKDRRGGSAQAKWLIGIAALLLVIVGIALNGSLAALGLAIPVLVASIAVLPAAARWRPIAIPLSLIVLVGGVAMLATAPIATEDSAEAATAINSRQEIWSTTSRAIADTFPVGTGLGTFSDIYSTYEDSSEVTTKYVNHAHNDYLELILELGAAGLILIVAFAGWWSVRAVRIWNSPLGTPFERAATIASAAILAHSAVDYPLRTAALAAIFAISVAIMMQPLRRVEAAPGREARAARHVKIG